MRALPATARACIACAVLAAALCVAPAAPAAADVPWSAVALLAAVCAACERLPRRTLTLPVLLAGAFLLPPAAAGLVAVPGALAGRVEQRPAGVRRLWHAAQLSLAACAASYVFGLAAPGPGRPGGFPAALPPALAAALAFSLVSAALDGAIHVTAERRTPRAAWRGLLPGPLLPVLVSGPTGLMTAVLWRSVYGPPAALLVLLPVSVSSWFLDRYERERASHQATIRALVQAVDLKDRYTRGHSERVGRASVLIARELGMAGERLEALRFAGILHDVGKLGVPTRLLRKEGPLTPEERRVIQLHPEYGHEMVRGIGFLDEARAAILHHHERLDGSGYPYGLRGRQIPLFARIVAVADAFDAMTSTRSYSRARPVPAALAELDRCAGTQFDPRMVGALVEALDRHGWHPSVTAGSGTGATLTECIILPSGNVPSTRDPVTGATRKGGDG
ncbi:HD-GYP domain-containing protein [Streptomyces albireticuli]|uniref:Metal-dependent phosphohydrolase n=1 Tax=Streptomyces albireticuli TaxID=1940 RepID=A0A2A2D9D4_9ACTN|nr:HD-GYP domain-containing protein [Streptomyces albireticuli]MCD9142486.1 HD-GYP domain-containing protein [Streptomyces albireticuli]MCD9163886.1 HD-GYP domain-containing protein [Streptomyces albireticuli]MCD9192614.1 HD-GYP domain-containing protein [Streptomyces albireticuli]PAU48046.1 metal-dependent phosphohydrolase [Streptomyces albireticuli]